MSTPASKLPFGILDLFGIKSQGSYPLLLRGDYQPTIEVLDMLHASHASQLALSGVVNTTGNQTLGPPMVVPQTEVWYVPALAYEMSANNVTGAFAVALSVLRPSGGLWRHLTDTQLFDATFVGALPNVVVREPFFLGPGQALGYRGVLGVATATLNFSVVPLRMQI